MSNPLDAHYWNSRYEVGSTGWDLKKISTPLKTYIDQLEDKDLKILIPGAGYGYEAEYLWNKGFKNSTVIDLSALALDTLRTRVPAFAKAVPNSLLEPQLIQGNFFDLEDTFDLILEQTFFCALDPTLRPQYATKVHELLRPEGKLVGLLFNFPLTEKGPPFGGDIEEYRSYFKDHFDILILERAYNSEKSRAGAELFIKLVVSD